MRFISVDYSVCTGCRTCEVVCSLHHFGECNPARSAIRVIRREKGGLVSSFPFVCQQCEKASCIEACPSRALSRNREDDPLTIDEEKCSGCGDCTDACPAGCIFLDNQRNLAVSCDLCGGQPQCILSCHSHSLTLGSSKEAGSRNRIERLATLQKAQVLGGSVARRGGP